MKIFLQYIWLIFTVEKWSSSSIKVLTVKLRFNIMVLIQFLCIKPDKRGTNLVYIVNWYMKQKCFTLHCGEIWGMKSTGGTTSCLINSSSHISWMSERRRHLVVVGLPTLLKLNNEQILHLSGVYFIQKCSAESLKLYVKCLMVMFLFTVTQLLMKN